MSWYWCNAYIQVGTQGIPHILLIHDLFRNDVIVRIRLLHQFAIFTSEFIVELMDIDSGVLLGLLPHHIVTTYQEVCIVLITFMTEESDVNQFVIRVFWRLLLFDFDSLFFTISLFLDEFVEYAINLAFIVWEESANIFLLIGQLIACFTFIVIAANDLTDMVEEDDSCVGSWLEHELHLTPRLKLISRNRIVWLLVKYPQ